MIFFLIKNKFIYIVSYLLVVLSSIVIISLYNDSFIYNSKFNNINSVEYSELLFTNNVVNKININIDNSDINELFMKEYNKDYFNCNININDETIYNVGIRIKGGSTRDILNNLNGASLKHSLKIKFDEYIDGQTYYGLDGIELNTQIHDKTFMRDYFAYDMMRFMGVPAPLVSFADVYINDEYWGFYVCIENVKDSFLKRNFGEDYGELYKPSRDFAYATFNDFVDWSKTNSSNEDINRLLDSIKKINNKDIENSVNINEVVKYFVVNNFTENGDGYLDFSNNYYLYEKNGLISMLPWDYDYSLYLFSSLERINYSSINNPFHQKKMTNYNKYMWKFIIENEQYLKLYYQYLQEFIDGYFSSGYFEKEYNRTFNLIEKNIYKDMDINKIIYKEKNKEEIYNQLLFLKKAIVARKEFIQNELSGNDYGDNYFFEISQDRFILDEIENDVEFDLDNKCSQQCEKKMIMLLLKIIIHFLKVCGDFN